MGFRFRKSVKLGKGVRLNLSKRGVGVSTGVKGARVGIGPRGVRQTVSVPGTGVSFVKERRLGPSKASLTPSSNNNHQTTPTAEVKLPRKNIKYPTHAWILIIVGLMTIPLLIGIPIFIFGIYNIYSYQKKDEAKAIDSFNKAMKKLKIGEYSSALDLLQKANKLKPNDEETMYYLMMCYHDFENDLKNSLMLGQKLLENDSENIIYKYCVASFYYKLKEYDQAISLLQELRHVKDIQEEATILLGKCFFKLEQFTAALEVLNQGPIRRRNPDPNMMDARYYLGLTCLKLGKNSRAKTHLSAVFANDINYKDIQSYKHLLD
ncbi:DUF4236 domain-containing protein [Proteinivorax hydrogeniformans]|uniref:DUF4236 domain-containing protein n=1 Tax=Proteinivorax hydrogeniformans TaxID=1826727 RepID=A0AAU8HW57_9FIRM